MPGGPADLFEVIKWVIFVWKTGDFLDFAKVKLVEWKLGWSSEIARAGFQSQSAPGQETF